MDLICAVTILIGVALIAVASIKLKAANDHEKANEEAEERRWNMAKVIGYE